MQRMTNPNYSSSVIHGEYYPHIDGIRALAVLPVVLFHILAILCPGGFAGVDVFFVISGYLITGGILRDLERDRFTIRNFYHRRIRRIMPAYFALIAGVFAAGCAIYYSTPLIHLGDASVMGTLFSANLYFWKMGGDYFAPDVHGNPLLHLWSLSVEEQFYLFIPLLCAIVWKIRRGMVAPVLALLAVLSLVGTIYAVLTGKQGGAFYLLHFRAWELLAGSLLAMMPAMSQARPNPSPARQQGDCAARIPAPIGSEGIRRGTNESITPSAASMDSSFTVASPPSPSGLGCAALTPTAEPLNREPLNYPLLATLGLLMVLIPYALLSSKSPFPGAAAISPVLGTALLIRYGSSGWVSRLLAWRPFVATGKISYSLYLWHWPVTVFWKYAVYDQLYWYDYTGMFLLSLLLGYLSWKFIELPVRTSQKWTMRRSFSFAASGIVLLVGLGIACVFSKGWPTILHPKANQFVNNSQSAQFVESWLRNKITLVSSKLKLRITPYSELPLWFGGTGAPHLGNPNRTDVFMIGDSHAGVLCHGMDIALQEKNLGAQDVNHSGKNVFDMDTPEGKTILTLLAESPATSKVFIVQYWSARWNKKSRDSEQLYVKLETFAKAIQTMGKTLYIATDVPVWEFSPDDIRARMEIISPRKNEDGWDGLMAQSLYERHQGDINRHLEKICYKTGAILLSLHLALKQGDHFIAFDNQNGTPVCLYRGTNHLSPYGSQRAARFILPYLFPEPRTQNKTPQAPP